MCIRDSIRAVRVHYNIEKRKVQAQERILRRVYGPAGRGIRSGKAERMAAAARRRAGVNGDNYQGRRY